MKRIALITIILALSCTCVVAQDSREIETKYGERANVYSVSERLWMTPSYDSQGQLCMMRVYPRVVSHDTNYLDPNLDVNEALKFINELFPVNTRGRRRDGFGLSDLGGGIVWTRFEYEHVHFVFISSFRLALPKQETAGNKVRLDFPIDEAALVELRRKKEMKSDDELIREHTTSPKILEIYWPNRSCVKP